MECSLTNGEIRTVIVSKLSHPELIRSVRLEIIGAEAQHVFNLDVGLLGLSVHLGVEQSQEVKASSHGGGKIAPPLRVEGCAAIAETQGRVAMRADNVTEEAPCQDAVVVRGVDRNKVDKLGETIDDHEDGIEPVGLGEGTNVVPRDG